MNASYNPNTIPFVIAAVGHRDLRPCDLEKLKDKVREVLLEFRRRMPKTPLMLMSGLAEGADQLVAEVAHLMGIQLVAVLPMPVLVYRQQLESAARDNFDTLLSKSTLRIELPLEGTSEEALITLEAARTECYERLARFLANQGQALIALWDGIDTGLPGGTWQIVDWMRNGPPAESEELDPQTARVYHIVTPRLKQEIPANAFECNDISSPESGQRQGPAKQMNHTKSDQERRRDEQYKKELDELERRLEAFNHQAADTVVSAPSNLIDRAEFPTVSAFAERTVHWYRVANTVSMRFRDQRRRILQIILLLAVVGVGAFELYSNVFDSAYLWLVLPLALFVAWCLHIVSRVQQVENLYLDSRALAEALRVQFYWELAGIRKPVAESSLQHLRSELDWIRSALRALALYQHAEQSREDSPQALQKVAKTWVQGQAEWFDTKYQEQDAELRLMERRANKMLLAILSVSFLIPISTLVYAPWHWLSCWQALAHRTPWHGALNLVVAIPALFAGLYRVWLEQAGYDVQAQKYNRMAHQLSRSSRKLSTLLSQDDLESARDLLTRIGVDALEENSEWLLLHRDRPLRVVGPF